MRGYLLDTNVISLLSPARDRPRHLEEWLKQEDAQGRIYLSAVTIHEIEKGITLLEHKGAGTKADGLRTWLSGLVSTFGDRILAIDASVSFVSGPLEAIAVASGHDPGLADALIAGTAKAHALTVVTGNGRHFELFGVPWLPPEACKASG